MRLSKRMVDILTYNITKSFGDVSIYLFGSRTDDSRSGGDIDIALEINLPKDEFRKKKAEFLASLARMGYYIKIDLVQYNHNEPLLYKEITNNHILLN